MSEKVTITISGPTGSGKTAIYMEIMIALKAIGVPVEHANEAAFRSVCNMGEADAETALALYQPTVTLVERNESRAARAISQADAVEALEEIASAKGDLNGPGDYARGWNAARFRMKQIAENALTRLRTTGEAK
jgi:ATP-dependent helicase YprA (DUF1998 family)